MAKPILSNQVPPQRPMNPAVKTAVDQTLERLEIEDPAIREAVARCMEALNSTHQAFNIKQAFYAWDEQRNQVFALICAVNSRLAKDEDRFNESQLLDIAESLLSNTHEVNRLKKDLGVEV